MSEPKQYWKSPAERDGDPEFLRTAQDEFGQELDQPAVQLGRRDFLKAAGFSAAVVTAAGCSRAPVEKAIPFLVQPEEMVPGTALHYASTCGGCSAGCGVLVKVRDGRPIKLEGNPEHPVSRGGLCAVGQASLLGLYDSKRYRQPQKACCVSTWAEADKAISAKLDEVRAQGGAVRFLSATVNSPTEKAAIRRFLAGFKDARHVQYDPLSSSAILDAHQRTHGARVLPHYRFERAKVIVSFDADFLGTWISPVEFTRGYIGGRKLESQPPRMSEHIQVESRMSLTGSKADRRLAMAPHDVEDALLQLAALVARRAGVAAPAGGKAIPAMEQVTEKLWAARGRSLVVSGSQQVGLQTICNFINHLLGNYGSTLDVERPSLQRQGSDADLYSLLEEIRGGKVAVLFVYGANPVYDVPGGEEVAAELKKLPLVVSFAERPDETAALAHWVCPVPHGLETWTDAEAVAGLVSVTQPTIQRLGETRALVESLAVWMGEPKPAYDLLREYWQAAIFKRQGRERDFQKFWDKAVYDGFVEVQPASVSVKAFNPAVLEGFRGAPMGEVSVVLHANVGMADGRHAYNAWLQELPDPVTKIAWDNYASLSPATAARLGVQQGDTVLIEAAGLKPLLLPVCVQPGQNDQTVAVALGYGSVQSARFADAGPRWFERRPTVGANGLVGVNAAPLLRWENGTLQYVRGGVKLTRGLARHELASTQDHHNLAPENKLALKAAEPRPIVQETTLAAYARDPKAGAPHGHAVEGNLWPADHAYTGHRWAMAIDLSACTGCSGCVVACQAENNIPVVGKDEVRRKREMHWLRIDRYYAETAQGVDTVYQPMLCQHCDNATCETVCPVLATVHGEEGLNQQVYNRCVGTRYCANNCAYKTRRFNWFDYAHDDRLQNLALNPDVTVRTCGIMEKCTFCVQRIQEAKIAARARGETVKDGDIQTACQQSCPAGAIVFGDMNDPNSKVSKLMASGRAYRVLEELQVKPSVTYLRVVRNRATEEHHG